MKKLILLIVSTISLSSFAQKTLKKEPKSETKRISIGINFSPDYCFRTLKNNDGTSSSDMVIDTRNKTENGKLGYTTGVNLRYNLTKKLGLETGIQYSNKGFQTTYSDDGLYTSEERNLTHNIYYIDIPLKADFIVADRNRFSLFSGVGITTNIFHSNGKHTHKMGYENKVNISPMVSIGMNYKLNKKMNLRIEPTFRHGVLKSTDTLITEFLWTSGVNFGYYFEL